MGAGKAKPEYMKLLEQKGIFARNYFCFSNKPEECFAITRSFNITDMDSNTVPLTYDDIWDRYDSLVRLTKEQYEEAQEAHWDELRARRGDPTNCELIPMVNIFVEEYTHFHTLNRWCFLCSYSEETIRRVLIRVTDSILGGKKSDQKQWQAQFDKMFKDVIIARTQAQRKPHGSIRSKKE